MHDQHRPHFIMTVTVWHGSTFGHTVELDTVTVGRPSTSDVLGSWSTLGIPGAVLSGITSSVHAVLTEHLVTRYGLADELPTRWAGDPEPF